MVEADVADAADETLAVESMSLKGSFVARALHVGRDGEFRMGVVTVPERDAVAAVRAGRVPAVDHELVDVGGRQPLTSQDLDDVPQVA
jgi:hypothetical protein